MQDLKFPLMLGLFAMLMLIVLSADREGWTIIHKERPLISGAVVVQPDQPHTLQSPAYRGDHDAYVEQPWSLD
jgi:hypothetical protein